jgi:hypothetical protein
VNGVLAELADSFFDNPLTVWPRFGRVIRRYEEESLQPLIVAYKAILIMFVF